MLQIWLPLALTPKIMGFPGRIDDLTAFLTGFNFFHGLLDQTFLQVSCQIEQSSG